MNVTVFLHSPLVGQPGEYFDTFPGWFEHPGRYKILSRVVYSTREGIKYVLSRVPPGRVLILGV